MIEARNVELQYKDGTVALKDINLSIQSGELVFITGPSGSGKTSLLKLLMGIEYPTGGELILQGQSMKKGRNHQLQKLRRVIGPVFQEFKLIDGRTALENIMMGMRFLGISPKKMKVEALSALTRVGLEHKAKTKVEHLSWGEAQRVAIARSVARRPSLILADEPTGNLDHDNAVNILNLLSSFKDHQTTVVITTHATHLIESWEKATFVRVKGGEITVERRGDNI
jgi:cell division transport system ATP-binding protein